MQKYDFVMVIKLFSMSNKNKNFSMYFYSVYLFIDPFLHSEAEKYN